jgi:hypothetical protein
MSITVPTQDPNGSGGLLNFIERASRDPEFDVAKFEALLRMQREIVQEQARVAFNRAMAEAQAEMMPVIRDATNVHTQSRYAKLETIDREMRPIYTKHGFGVRFGSDVAPREGWLRIVCTVSHTGGYSETNYLDAPPDTAGSQGKVNKTPVQAVGSSVSYLRRYLLAMVFNIVLADDDDGHGGTTRDEQAARAYPGGARKPPDPLDEPNGTLWLKNLLGLLAGAETQRAALDLRTDPRVVKVLESPKTPSLIKGQIIDRFREAFERFAKVPDRPNGEDTAAGDPPADWEDPIAELLAELDARLDLMALNQLIASAEWHARVRNEASFPPDATRLNEAIAARRAALEGRA